MRHENRGSWLGVGRIEVVDEKGMKEFGVLRTLDFV
jgi:hypothetical protein